MRLALLGVAHETNTFSRVAASYDLFTISRSDEIVRQYGESHSTNAGYLEAADRFDCEVVPLVYATGVRDGGPNRHDNEGRLRPHRRRRCFNC